MHPTTEVHLLYGSIFETPTLLDELYIGNIGNAGNADNATL